MPVEILVDEDVALQALTTQDLVRAYQAVCQTVDDPAINGGVCLRLCGAEVSRSLNAAFRGKDQPTNVLSFAAELDFTQEPMLGDLALCWPVLVDEASSQGKPVRHHAVHLAVHGLLHLLDYDHEDVQAGDIMEALEVKILAGLNIPDPYAVRL